MVQHRERDGDSLDGYAAKARKILYGSIDDALVGIWKELPKHFREKLPPPQGYV